MQIKTNHKPRHILYRWQLTPKESAEFDYLPENEGEFLRYKGQVYDLGEFMRIEKSTAPHCQREGWEKWHGYSSDSFFSGVLVKYCEGFESVIVGTYYS